MGHSQLASRCCVFLYAASSWRESLMSAAALIFVIDDDPSVRSSLKFLLSTVGLQVETFESADSFLRRKRS